MKAVIAKEQVVAERQIRTDFDMPWKELFQSQEADRREFRQNETTLLGRAYNILRYTDWKEVFSKQQDTGEQGPSIFSKAFNAIGSSGHRQEVLANRQLADQERLRQEQQRLEKLSNNHLKAEQARQIEINKATYVRKAQAMKERQSATKQEVRLEQQLLTKERNNELKAYRERQKAMKQQRVREQDALENQQQERQVDLTKEANDAFGVSQSENEQASGESKVPDVLPDKTKRTRKRQDPSERTNRRHTKEIVEAKITNDENIAKQIESWEERRTNRFGHQRDQGNESEHER